MHLSPFLPKRSKACIEPYEICQGSKGVRYPVLQTFVTTNDFPRTSHCLKGEQENASCRKHML